MWDRAHHQIHTRNEHFQTHALHIPTPTYTLTIDGPRGRCGKLAVEFSHREQHCLPRMLRRLERMYWGRKGMITSPLPGKPILAKEINIPPPNPPFSPSPSLPLGTPGVPQRPSSPPALYRLFPCSLALFLVYIFCFDRGCVEPCLRSALQHGRVHISLLLPRKQVLLQSSYRRY